LELGHLAAEHFAERPEPTRGARDRTPSYAVAPSAASDTSRAVTPRCDLRRRSVS
jgi:hypothetical protein